MDKSCKFGPCYRMAITKGYCGGHYKQIADGRELSPLRVYNTDGCSFPDCDKPHDAHGLCGGHNKQSRRGEELRPLRRRNPGQWGSWYKNKAGYILRSRVIDGKRETQFQHRLVLSEAMGRELLSNENPHHINGLKDDNRPDNLELWTISQPPGQRVEDKIAWAIEFLNQYDYTVISPESS